MKFIAFIRNINVGQARFPSRTKLVEAFLTSGAHNAISFQSNGTVVFDLTDDVNLLSFKEDVYKYLRQNCSFSEALFIRNLEAIKAVVRQNPFAAINRQGYHHEYVSYYDCPNWTNEIFPLESPKKDCIIFSGNAEEAFSIAKDFHGISGYPTPLLEKILGIPVTTRSWTTIERLSSRF
jgi:uncharacterized protein (DUF1697 family)